MDISSYIITNQHRGAGLRPAMSPFLATSVRSIFSQTRNGILLALLCPLVALPQHSTTNNPFNTPMDRQEGARLFRGQCAACHGPGGAGGASGPSLTSGIKRSGDSDDLIFQLVAKGIPGTNMPAFPGSGREVWQIVAYVRSLSVGKAAELAKGDAGRGANLFATKGCRNCHQVNGEGGTAGPDLSDIGRRRSLVQLQRSITEPNEDVSPDYWQLVARTTSGREISGVRMNEDTYSYQYRDNTGLKSVSKSELAEHKTVSTSLMPPFRDKLTPAEIDDLVAWLAARQEEGGRP